MARRVPEGPPPPPVVARIRLRYAKRGRLRFSSHRDFARALERALRRADLPMAYSAGFSPHPKISYVGAAPTGVASEAEYVEIGLAQVVEPDAVRERLDAVLPDGLDIVDAVLAGPGSLAERMHASHWQLALPGVGAEAASQAVDTFLAVASAPVERLTKDGRRLLDAREPVVSMTVLTPPSGAATSAAEGDRAIIDTVVRQVTPTVRPDDLVTALRDVGGLALADSAAPAVAVRLAQGPLDDAGTVGDPLAVDRSHRERTTTTAPAEVS